MKRLVEAALRGWKDARRRKPLLIRGARQVGKTFSVKAFASNHFDTLVTIDLERQKKFHRIFEGDLSGNAIVDQIRLLNPGPIVPGKTLLFIDEIQACPRAIVALRYLYEDVPDLHVIAAGSLLDFVLEEISFPVGRLQILDMYPMTFAEFLRASGNDNLAELVLGPPRPVADAVHLRLLSELQTYAFLGGMPEAVSAYCDKRSLSDGVEVIDELIAGYRLDFPKYAKRSNPEAIDAVFSGVARLSGEQVKYTRLADGFSPPTLRKAFNLLCKARVVTAVHATQPQLPLGAGVNAKRLKSLVVDVGILQQARGTPVGKAYLEHDLMAVHRGAIAEQLVGQELLAAQGGDLYYWARDKKGSSAEVDYLLSAEELVWPVEVKSGASGRLRSLHLFLQAYPHCSQGLVLSTRPLARLPEQRLTFLPLYWAYALGLHGLP